MASNTRWDNRKKKVVVEMSWEDARDLGQWMKSVGDAWGDDLIKAAKEGAGFGRDE